jgi:hypothetical protein
LAIGGGGNGVIGVRNVIASLVKKSKVVFEVDDGEIVALTAIGLEGEHAAGGAGAGGFGGRHGAGQGSQ